MSYTVENLEKSMAKITITVDADAFEEAMVKSYNKNKKNISIQGFRKGKAPRKMVEKLYGPEVFYEDAKETMQEKINRMLVTEVSRQAIQDKRKTYCYLQNNLQMTVGFLL